MSCRCGGGCAFKTSREGLGLVDTEAIPKIPLSLKKKNKEIMSIQLVLETSYMDRIQIEVNYSA
jgi:hypothetical protein